MNLCIDQGNTRTKAAIFESDLLIKQFQINESSLSDFEEIFDSYPIANCILSTVRESNEIIIKYLKSKCDNFIFLSHETALPITNTYKTPQTLGKDRLAAVIGAYTLAPEKASLIIDAGTAITYDFINANGIYEGGNIAPGLSMRLNALHDYTQKLPLIEAAGETLTLGKNTEEAIRSGVVNGMIYEIEGYISILQKQHLDLNIFFTGGDTFFFEHKLKNTIFANQNLVLIGLNRIINYNA